MRVTNNMMTSNLLYNVNKNLEYMSKRQDELATGHKIHRPSDDPVLASKVLARRTDLSELNQYDKNTRDALGWLEITEKALEDNGDIFQRIRELTVQASNGTNTEEDTQKIKKEIESMKEQLISNANTTFAGRYIFSGFETDKKLMNKDGTYNIDIDTYTKNNAPVVEYEVSVGESMDVMTNGLDIYGMESETNILNSIYPTTINNQGVAATKSIMSGSFDLNQTYAAGTLDFNIGIAPDPVTNITVDVTNLNGTASVPITKEDVLEAYNTALGANGTAYYDANDQLVIEAAQYEGLGDITFPIPPALAPAGYSPTVTAGVDKVEAELLGPVYAGTFSAEEKDILRTNPMIIVVNGESKKLLPDPGAPINDITEYAAALQAQADLEFGPNQVIIDDNAGGNQLRIATTSPAIDDDIHVKADLIVDFPRTRTSTMMKDIDDLIGYLETGEHDKISNMLGTIDEHVNNMLALRADIGARTNRMEMISKKIASNSISFTQLLSDAQDADMSEVIMQLKNAENVYQASLSTGARVIQPSLIDFLG